MPVCLISVAGNIDPHHWLPRAVRSLLNFVQVQATSPFFVTPPIARPDQPHYRNGVLRCYTDLLPHPLKFEVLRTIEAKHGRQRGGDPYAARTVDLDLLDWGGITMDMPGLRLPDPDLTDRPFLAVAVLALDPEYFLPDGSLLREHFDPAVREVYPVDIPLTRIIEEVIAHECRTSQ